MIFTDDQIKSLTQDMCDYPTSLESLNANLSAAIDSKDKWLDKDGGNGVYTNDLLNIHTQYHEEYRQMTNTYKTTYSSGLIDPSAQLSPGNAHFPTDPIPYIGFPPKIVDSNLGNPTGASTGTERESLNSIRAMFALLTGFSSPNNVSSFVYNYGFGDGYAFNQIQVIDASDQFAIGDKILFLGASNYLYGTITNKSFVAFNQRLLTVSIIASSAGYGGIVQNDYVANFHAGFSVSQIDNGIGGGEGVYLDGLKNSIDTYAADWKSRINNTIAAIDANTAVGAEATQKDAQKVLLQAHQATITAWQSYPYTGSGTSRFGSNRYVLENDINLREYTHIPARTSEINGYMGTISQAPDGAYSGSGHYHELLKNLDARLNRVSGSLRNYYGIDLAVKAINAQIDSLDKQFTRDSNTFNLKKFSSNGNNTNTITLEAATGLAVSNAVKIMSSTQPVLSATISGISGNNVTLNIVVPNTYKVSECARLVKQN